jgi:4-hydroxy-3-polyprenylbenzoate decarboxylase
VPFDGRLAFGIRWEKPRIMPATAPLLNLTLAFTGASGPVLGKKALQLLVLDSRVGHINLIPSAHSLRVIGHELGIPEGPADELPRRLLGESAPKVQVHDNRDIGAVVASGSYPSNGMLVIPCSMGTLSAIAHGASDNLIERAADVCLKERRPLVLAAREAPLSLIHLRNMTAVTEAGAIVFPVIPAFYDLAQTVDAMVTQYVRRVLAHLGLPSEEAFQWKGGSA